MIKKNVAFSLAINLLNLGYPLISFTYVARILNPEGVGIFNYSLSIVGYFLVFSNIGIPRIAPVDISKIKDDEVLLMKKINGYFSLNIITSFIVIFLYIIIVFLFTKPYSLQQFLLLILSVQILCNCIGLDWLMQGMLHFKQLVIRDLVVKISSLILLFILVKNSSDIIIYCLLYIGSSIISSIVNYLYLKKKYKIRFGFDFIFQNIAIKELLINVFPISILTTIYLFFDTSFAGYFLSMYDVGIYSFSIKIIRLFLIIFDSIFVVLTPVLAYKLAQQLSIVEINDTFKIIISYLFALFLPLCFLIVLFSDNIIFFLGGVKFYESSIILKGLLPMSFFYIFSSLIGSQILYNLGELVKVRNILLGVIVFSIIFGYIIIGRMKLIGVVITVNFAFLLLTIFYCFFAKRALKGIRLLHFKCIYKYFVSTGFSFLVCFLIIRISFVNNILHVLSISVLYFFLYGGFLFLLKEEYLMNNMKNLIFKVKND